jgi:hypothetical protein
MRRSTSTPRFPHAGWLSAKMSPWLGKKVTRASPLNKRRASPEDLEQLRQKFEKPTKN